MSDAELKEMYNDNEYLQECVRCVKDANPDFTLTEAIRAGYAKLVEEGD